MDLRLTLTARPAAGRAGLGCLPQPLHTTTFTQPTTLFSVRYICHPHELTRSLEEKAHHTSLINSPGLKNQRQLSLIMSSTSPTATPWVRLAQATTILLPAITCGVNMADSFLLIPTILQSPTPLMLRQWAGVYARTRVFFPAVLEPVAVVSYLLSWHLRGGATSRSAKLYLAVGMLCQAIGAYTWVVVFPTNKRIIRKVEETRGAALTEETEEVGVSVRREESAKWLVDHWGVLNLPRGIMMGVASVLGLVATL